MNANLAKIHATVRNLNTTDRLLTLDYLEGQVKELDGYSAHRQGFSEAREDLKNQLIREQLAA